MQEPGYMFSNNFSKEHYEQYMFGDKPFTLFNGDKVQTFKQYYEEQSVEAIRSTVKYRTG